MNQQLSISIGQASTQGLKQSNQDCQGLVLASEPMLTTKGIAIAIADGISSSDVSHIASQTSIKSFLEDYYCTSETWSVKTSAERVIQANNSWMFAQNQRQHEYRLNRDKGYVCTFSALILKSNTAHILHVGDAQIYRLAMGTRKKSDVFTEQHRLWVSADQSYLARAIGVSQKLEIDYLKVGLEIGDTFMLSTDGVYEFISHAHVQELVEQHNNDLDIAANNIIKQALDNGSDDNLTVQLVRIDSLPKPRAQEFLSRLNTLPFPPSLSPRAEFDGYKIIRSLHKSNRSHVLLAEDLNNTQRVCIKLPSTEGRASKEYLERFLLEDWIAQRVNNAHVLKAYKADRARGFCYVVNEYIEGQSLAQWMIDNPSPSINEVRSIIRQIANGLQAFHRQEMLHQDLRPENIMIDQDGTAKIIDFGSSYVSGIAESHVGSIYQGDEQSLPGTAQFLAPEYFIGEPGSKRSDLYSLACICYHMLTGRSPYGAAVARALSRSAQNRLVYQSAMSPSSDLPSWLDMTLKKALQADPSKRYAELSEFIQDLRKPNPKFLSQARAPLLERNPVRFWQGVSSLLSITVLVLSYLLLK